MDWVVGSRSCRQSCWLTPLTRNLSTLFKCVPCHISVRFFPGYFRRCLLDGMAIYCVCQHCSVGLSVCEQSFFVQLSSTVYAWCLPDSCFSLHSRCYGFAMGARWPQPCCADTISYFTKIREACLEGKPSAATGCALCV